jgi:hypothetical protein
MENSPPRGALAIFEHLFPLIKDAVKVLPYDKLLVIQQTVNEAVSNYLIDVMSSE